MRTSSSSLPYSPSSPYSSSHIRPPFPSTLSGSSIIVCLRHPLEIGSVNTFYRQTPAPPVARRPPPTTASCIPSPSAFTRKDADDARVITNQVIARVIVLAFSTLTSWPFNYTSTAPFAVIFVYTIGKLIRRMQTGFRYPFTQTSPLLAPVSFREQSVLTLSYKIAFCQRLRRYQHGD